MLAVLVRILGVLLLLSAVFVFWVAGRTHDASFAVHGCVLVIFGLLVSLVLPAMVSQRVPPTR